MCVYECSFCDYNHSFTVYEYTLLCVCEYAWKYVRESEFMCDCESVFLNVHFLTPGLEIRQLPLSPPCGRSLLYYSEKEKILGIDFWHSAHPYEDS